MVAELGLDGRVGVHGLGQAGHGQGERGVLFRKREGREKMIFYEFHTYLEGIFKAVLFRVLVPSCSSNNIFCQVSETASGSSFYIIIELLGHFLSESQDDERNPSASRFCHFFEMHCVAHFIMLEHRSFLAYICTSIILLRASPESGLKTRRPTPCVTSAI